MPAYLDASALVSIVIGDIHADAVRHWLIKNEMQLATSVFGRIEFASAVSLRYRRGDMSGVDAQSYLDVFDDWLQHNATEFGVNSNDFDEAEKFVRRFDLKLRGPDALHIATCARLKAHLITFDQSQAHAARVLGLNVEMPL